MASSRSNTCQRDRRCFPPVECAAFAVCLPAHHHGYLARTPYECNHPEQKHVRQPTRSEAAAPFVARRRLPGRSQWWAPRRWVLQARKVCRVRDCRLRAEPGRAAIVPETTKTHELELRSLRPSTRRTERKGGSKQKFERSESGCDRL